MTGRIQKRIERFVAGLYRETPSGFSEVLTKACSGIEPHRILPMLGLMFFGLIVIVAIYRDFGISWDEPVQSHFGEGVVRYFASGGDDRSVNDYLDMRFYGPLFELGTALLYGASSDPSGNPAAKYEVRHLATAISGLVAVLGVMFIARNLPGRWTMLYSGIALATLPRFFGHAFINSKDIPFACGFAWSMAGLIALNLEPRSTKRAVLAAAPLAITLGIRPGGLPLLLALHACIAAIGFWSRGETKPQAMVRPLMMAAMVWVVAWLGMISLWPWAHEAPFMNPISAIRAALSFSHTFPVLFDGRVTMSDSLPRYYLVKYLAITTPPLTLILFLIGIAASVRSQLHHRASSVTLVLASLQLWLIVPLVLLAIRRPTVYDGIRHVLFVLPAVALFAGWGATWLVERMTKGKIRGLASVLLGLALVLPAVHVVRLHPYQMTYFNALVGGLEGANGKYEMDYWLLSYKEAMEWVNERAKERPDGKLRILVAIDEYSYACAAAFAAPGIEIEEISVAQTESRLPLSYDYSVAMTRYGMHRVFPGSPVVHRIEREGGVFSVIRSH